MSAIFDGLTPEKTILITGARRGSAAALPRGFYGTDAEFHVCDVSEPAVNAFCLIIRTPQRLWLTLAWQRTWIVFFSDLGKRHGRLECWSTMRHRRPHPPVEDVTVADWERTIAVDLNAHFYATGWPCRC